MKPAESRQVSQQVPQSIPQPAQTATGMFASARSVAFSLLVDRALTA